MIHHNFTIQKLLSINTISNEKENFTCIIYLSPFCNRIKCKYPGGLLPLNGSVTGVLGVSTVDVWDVTTNADGLLRLTFKTVSPADLDVTLYDNDGHYSFISYPTII